MDEVQFIVRPHSLRVHSYRSPTFCDFCGQLLFGIIRQGLKCEGCNCNFHKRCAFKIPNNCTPPLESLEIMANENSTISMVSSNSPITKRSGPSDNWWGSGRPAWIDVALHKRVQVPHTFTLHTFKKPTICQLCSKLLLGICRQGYRCKDCKFSVHKRCMKYAAKNCTSEVLYINQRSVNQYGTIPEINQITISDLPDSNHSLDTLDTNDEKNSGTDETNGHSELTPNGSCIPLQRLIQTQIPLKKPSKELYSNWIIHYTDADQERKCYFWVLDTKNLSMFLTEDSEEPCCIIQLSEILNLATSYGSNNSISNVVTPSYYFLFVTAKLTYFVGAPSDEVLFENGVGEELAKFWEKAISEALQPNSIISDSSLGLYDIFLFVMILLVLQYQQIIKGKDITSKYQIDQNEILGAGQFGIVYGGALRCNGRAIAIKVVDKSLFSSTQERRLKNEVDILQSVSHPGVVILENVYETPEKVFVVMEKLDGDMLELILSSPRSRLNERMTKYLVLQILYALRYLHSKNVAHCDLKPENVLILKHEEALPQIKLCDFGFAKIIGERSFRKSIVGTPAYLAPEVFKNKRYNRLLDLWSVGVIIYVSLSGTFPFNEDEEIKDQIESAAFMYPDNPWAEISQDAINLINNLLQIELKKRYSVDKAIYHKWLQVSDRTVTAYFYFFSTCYTLIARIDYYGL
ncbi:uncharacterized protein TRIADDRAFT_30089 [Trichoplax adhaerens]|uniref:Uncharacterized protein n=1 Tax=Trichoplax adhaerens TaxID=10228 RepID=B3S6K4_TRIAD|nr:hypothetical protein TRIADDRAFT_30089 [Trichoplax adhaerens]EDV21634.1 hypothetical protein TRIADDRAFT_30089 [Trichoplax adhaerens]|eukprot:XP_002115782.1 hypothetical protein TRIADDRAFT_30089 [Trichoplax adhaerens]